MLEVRLLGQFEARQDGAVVVIPSRAAQSLFAYLLLTVGTLHRREQLAGLLWPDTTDENARKNLRHELWRLRKSIETKKPRKKPVAYLMVDEISIGWDAKSDYSLDVAVVLEPMPPHISADQLVETLALYRGELLPGMYEDWVVLERERVRAVLEQKMARLLELLVEGKRWPETLEWGERWIALGQTPEPAYRALMVAHAALGDMSQVASVYERCVRAMRDDLGVEPSAATEALFEQLSKGERRTALRETTYPVSKPQGFTLPSHVSNLPVPLTSFIGREKELKEIARLLSSARLLTLMGPGGVGKTRSALQSATESVEKYKDGVWWVDLAALVDEELLPHVVAQALEVRGVENQSMMETLVQFLRNRHLLLVLDNCEHLVDACARLCERLLGTCRNLKILVTSREALGITGEVLYQVPTLSLPESPLRTSTETLMEYEGIRLFVERARAVKSDIEVTEQNATAVLQICQRLEGIPLALELAAARAKLLSVEHIAERLNDRFDLLTQGSRTALPRQQTLRAAIDWSYDLLPEETRILFLRLSVMAGGFTLEAVEGICTEAPLDSRILLDQLTRLIDRSLVKVERQGEGARYRMLETIREYAHDKLAAFGETERLGQRHRDFFIAFAERAESKLKGAEQIEWLDRLEAEHDNLRAAWDWAIESDIESASSLASALLDFWFMRGNPSEGREWLAKLLERTQVWGQTAPRAHVLSVAGRLAYSQRDFAMARQFLEKALAIARITGDLNEIAFALLWLGWTVHRQRDDQIAQVLIEECLTIYQKLQDPWGTAMAIYHMAGVAAAQGHYAEAKERYMTSRAKFQELGDRFREGYVLNGLGELARLLGQYERAGKFYGEHIEILREQRSPVSLVVPLVNQGWVALHEGDYDKAQALFGESLGLSSQYEYKTAVADCLAGFAAVLGMSGKPDRAVRLFGAVESLLEEIGMGRRMDPSDQKEVDHYIDAVRAQFDVAAFADAWMEGRAMTMDQAVAYALEDESSDNESVAPIHDDSHKPTT